MKILLATDGSDCARAAVDFLLGFPFPGDSSITLLAVIDERTLKHFHLATDDDEQHPALQEAEQTLREDSEKHLAGELRRLQAAGRAGSTEIRSGNPAEEIITLAKELQADLIMVGSHGSGGLGDFLLGHVSDRLLQYAPCSVLITRAASGASAVAPAAAETSEPWRVLLAYDNSVPAQQALALCAALPFDSQAEINVVSVMPMVTAFRQDIRQRMNALWQQKKHAVQAALDQAAGRLSKSTPNVQAHLREGTDVAKEILDTAAETGTNLIMLGCKGEGAITRFLLGSITNRIARHASCSVWAVRS